MWKVYRFAGLYAWLLHRSDRCLKLMWLLVRFFKMPSFKLTTPNPVLKVLGLNFKGETLGSIYGDFYFWSWTKIFSFGRKYFIIELNLRVKNSERKSIGGFTNVWMSVKLIYFDYDFYIYTYRYLKKRQKEKINFDELPKNY